MSRLLLNNSNAVIQRATAAAANANGAASCSSNSMRTTSPVLSKHVARRWKSLLIHVSNQQQKHRLFSTAAFSSAQTFNAGTSRLITSSNSNPLSATKYCRTLTTSTVLNSLPRTEKMPEQANKCLQLDNINPNFITMEYAVRGPLVIRAGEIERELKEVCKKDFIYTYILFLNNPSKHKRKQALPVVYSIKNDCGRRMNEQLAI